MKLLEKFQSANLEDIVTASQGNFIPSKDLRDNIKQKPPRTPAGKKLEKIREAKNKRERARRIEALRIKAMRRRPLFPKE